MNCPVCNVNLTMTFRENVEIDYCPKCRGIWLDRGEIEKIIEKATGRGFEHDDDDDDHHRRVPPTPPVVGHPQQSHPQQYPPKKKSFLTEIFDWD